MVKNRQVKKFGDEVGVAFRELLRGPRSLDRRLGLCSSQAEELEKAVEEMEKLLEET